MSRIVELKKKVDITERKIAFAGGESAGWQDKLKEYGERVAKYVPAEVLAFYSGAVQLILTKEGTQYAGFRLWAFIIFGLVAWIFTPIYIGKFSTNPRERRINQVMATTAFGIWAYAYPAGFFAEMGWHDPVIAGLLLLCFTFVSGFYQPKE